MSLGWAFLGFAGCHKGGEARAEHHNGSDASAAEPIITQPASPPANPVEVNPGTDPAGSLAQLTQVTRRFSFERRHVPKSLEEVVSAGYLKSIPQAPPGQKYVVDPKSARVLLARQ